MNQWYTNGTQAVITNHCKDFNSSNYTEKMKQYGGFIKYIQDVLGGVFKTYYEKMINGIKVSKLSEYYQAIDFVMGLMAIVGFDYSNGDSKTSTYWHWGSSTSKPANDAFYLTGKGKCNGGTIIELCTGSGGKGRTTNCNYGVDTLLKAMGRYYKSCDSIKTWANKYGKPVANKSDLKPGDIVHFFSKQFDRTKVSTWDGKYWHHVAMVHTVDRVNKKIWLADFGSRFIKSKKPLHYMTLDDSAKAGGEYNYYWIAIHAFDFEDDVNVKEKTIADKAVELKRETDAWNMAKKKEYGDEIFNLTQNYMNNREVYLLACADYVFNGYAGKGEARQVFFGDDYNDVQAMVTKVDKLAHEVIDNKYGKDPERSEKLGIYAYVVQNRVNQLYREGLV